jgi:ubiquitin conjugation factor E4 B
MPQLVSQYQCDELATFCITFLRSPEYIKNPYLKSKLVTMLCFGSRPLYLRGQGVMVPYLSTSKVATEHLLHALIRFYIDIEHTGAHNQFFDKFNIRFEIFQIIEKIWEYPTYRKNLSEESVVNNSLFVKFVNLLLNDSTYVLDEAFTALGKIHDLQKELAAPDTTPPNPDPNAENPRRQSEENLQREERMAGSYMQLVNETIKMLKKFTGAIRNSFTVASIVQRLADMLDLNLVTLVGPRGANLKVQNSEKYSFRPRALLADLAEVYINLSKSPEFIEAVVKDERSFQIALFEKTADLLQRNELLAPEKIRVFTAFLAQLKVAKSTFDSGEQELGDDIPDEYLDPLLFHLMSDPVTLPASQVNIDRSTIESHLLSFPHDPFNRAPLTLEQVVPNEELKKEIEEWVKKRREKGLAPVAGEEEVREAVAGEGDREEMDTTD